jgi:hypothetical protein
MYGILCKMRVLVLLAALVPAAAGHVVDLRATPTVSGARLRIAVKQDGGTGNVRTFAVVHEQPMHLFVVGDGLDFFAHEYPAPQADGVFLVDLALPRPGLYMAIVEFQPEPGAPQMVHQAFTTGSAFGRIARPVIDASPKLVDGVRVTLDASAAKAGESRPLTAHFEDAATGAALADLEPSLGAAAHLLAVSPDLTEAVHDHPAAAGGGPDVTFRPLLPRAGPMKVWIQFQRGGRTGTAAFVIDVP